MKVVAQAPCRASLFGGGTDLDEFAQEFGGICVNLAINLRQQIYIDHNQFEEFPPRANKDFIHKILEKYKVKAKVISTCDAELGSGLGTSAAAAVALVSAISKLKGLNLDKTTIAEAAWKAEYDMKWFGGKQDQYASVYGGCNVMEFGKKVNVIPLARGGVEPLEKAMVLFYIGPREIKHPQEKLKELTTDQKVALSTIKEIALVGMEHVASGNWQKVGELLDEAWVFKKKSNPNVSNEKIDGLYFLAREHGALGGKVLGAGSGGHMLFVVDPERKERFIEAMPQTIKNVDFSIDWQGAEARII